MEEILKKLDLVPQDLTSILIMTVVFALFWRIVGRGVIQKYLDLYEAREQSTTGATSNAEENLITAQKLLEECEKTLVLERAKVIKNLEPKISEAKSKAAEVLSEVEKHAQINVQKTRESIAQEGTQLFASLEARSDELAQQISDRALN